MPREAEQALQREARRKIRSKGDFASVEERRNAYVYGGMRATGWKPGPPNAAKAEGEAQP